MSSLPSSNNAYFKTCSSFKKLCLHHIFEHSKYLIHKKLKQNDKKTTLRNKSIGNKETKIIAILTKAIITIVKVAIRRMKLTVVIIMVIVVVSLWNM